MPNEWRWRKEDRLQGGRRGWDPHTKSALRGAFTHNNIPHPEYLWICFSMLCLRFAQSHLLLLWPPHTTTSQRSPSAVHWFFQTGRKCSPTVQVLETHLGKDAFVWICFLHRAHEFVGFTLIYLASYKLIGKTEKRNQSFKNMSRNFLQMNQMWRTIFDCLNETFF